MIHLTKGFILHRTTPGNAVRRVMLNPLHSMADEKLYLNNNNWYRFIDLNSIRSRTKPSFRGKSLKMSSHIENSDITFLTYFDDLTIRSPESTIDAQRIDFFFKNSGMTDSERRKAIASIESSLQRSRASRAEDAQFLVVEREFSCLGLAGLSIVDSLAVVQHLSIDSSIGSPDDLLLFLLSCLESRARMTNATLLVVPAKQSTAAAHAMTAGALSMLGFAAALESPPALPAEIAAGSPAMFKRLDRDRPGAGGGRGGAKGAEELIEAVRRGCGLEFMLEFIHHAAGLELTRESVLGERRRQRGRE